MCFLHTARGQQLKFVQHEDIDDNFKEKFASDSLHWPDSNIHKQESNHFKHRVQNDFVETVHIVFMNHLGMECCYCVFVLSSDHDNFDLTKKLH